MRRIAVSLLVTTLSLIATVSAEPPVSAQFTSQGDTIDLIRGSTEQLSPAFHAIYDRGKPVLETQTLNPAQLDSAMRHRMQLYKISAATAAIVVGDSIVWTGAYGFSDTSQTIPVADSTVFRIASISKTVVATAVLQLWEHGLINLDANVNEYLPFPIRNPYFPNDSITIRMLLSHASSIDEKQALIWGADLDGIPLETWLRGFINDSGGYSTSAFYLTEAPGTVGKYSNVGFCLLALVVEHVTGSSFEQYCHDSIFVPLTMTETSFFVKNLDTANIAPPMWFEGGKFRTRGILESAGYPAGSLKTSVVQLARFLSAFLGQGKYRGVRVLDSATVDSVKVIQYPSLFPLPEYGAMQFGLGWYRHNWMGGTQMFWGHEGEIIRGTRTFMYCSPEENTGAIVLTNSTDYLAGPIANERIYNLVWEFSRDTDKDGIIAGFDNCPELYNPDQTFVDDDHDGYPDNCEPDVDHDGALTADDNCPDVANPGQEDANHDGIGDACCCIASTGNVDCDQGDGCDISDLSALIDNLYISFTPLCCPKEANVDGQPGTDISDLSALIDYLYISFTPPAACQ